MIHENKIYCNLSIDSFGFCTSVCLYTCTLLEKLPIFTNTDTYNFKIYILKCFNSKKFILHNKPFKHLHFEKITIKNLFFKNLSCKKSKITLYLLLVKNIT